MCFFLLENYVSSLNSESFGKVHFFGEFSQVISGIINLDMICLLIVLL